MSTDIKLKRGTTQNRMGYTPLLAEPIFDIDKFKMYLGDGTTVGGLAVEAEVDIYQSLYRQRWISEDDEAQTMDMIAVDTTGGSVRLLFPEYPNVGDEIRIIDAEDSFNSQECRIDGNGHDIHSSSSDYILGQPGAYIAYFARDSSWWITPDTGYQWYYGGVGGPWNPRYTIAGSYVAVANDLYLADTTVNEINIQLPSNPILGDRVKVVDFELNFNTNNCNISDPTYMIDNTNEDFILQTRGESTVFTFGLYRDGTRGWSVSTGSTLLPGGGGDSEFDSYFEVISPTGNFYTAHINDLVMVDTRTATMSIELPAGSLPGDKVEIVDAYSTFSDYPCFVLRNGSTINDREEDLILNTDNTYTCLVYTDNSNWVTIKDNNATSQIALLNNGDVAEPNSSNMVNTEYQVKEIFLPDDPLTGQWVQIFDAIGSFATNECTINPNGNNIDSLPDSLVLSVDDQNVKLTYSNASAGWIIDYGAASNPASDFAPFNHDNGNHTEVYITTAGVTAAAFIANNGCGTTHNHAAYGDHTHPRDVCTKVEVEAVLTGRITTHNHATFGSGSFQGNNTTIQIAHGLGTIPSHVNVISTQNADGALGEVWVAKTSVYIIVGNTGTWTGPFSWEAIT